MNVCNFILRIVYFAEQLWPSQCLVLLLSEKGEHTKDISRKRKIPGFVSFSFCSVLFEVPSWRNTSAASSVENKL